MPQNVIQPRDLEILRTLTRLRYVTGCELKAAFFPSDDAGRKRLKRLSDRGLIRMHANGLPARLHYDAFRITQRGLDLVIRAWPDEHVPDRLLEHLADGSLYNWQHREGLARLYLRLVRPHGQIDLEDVRAGMEKIRERADTITWRPDGEVALRFRRGDRNYEVIPDATVGSRVTNARIFLELDRSTKPLLKIRRNLERYAMYLKAGYASDYPDGRPPTILYVVCSEGRRAAMKLLCQRALGPNVAWAVELVSEIQAWLEPVLFGDARTSAQTQAADPLRSSDNPVSSEPLRDAAQEVLFWANDLLRNLKSRGVLDPLRRERPQLLVAGREKLLALHRELGLGEQHAN